LVNVTFFGVRGSTPCASEQISRYGGNTSSVVVEVPRTPPILLDLGTGVRVYGESLESDGPFVGVALVSHLHWDHVQGLPFCAPVNAPGAELDIYGPPQDGLDLEAAFEEFMRPPYFPVRINDLLGEVRFHTVDQDDFVAGDVKVRSRYVPHIGATLGYRVEYGGFTVAYISDHQQPLDGSFRVAQEALELADGADLLIHDAQYTGEEFEAKPHWGHCSVDYALHVASEAGVAQLALFHHDPSHSDAVIDAILLDACEKAAALDIGEVLAASEGLTIALTAPVDAAHV
jgi:phosphoribosyl 1,2-cyclic phosphodiesterase